ncbi:MAG: xanthine dehydrogenase accessory protein XdhC [Sulfitobacter sp.]
MNDIYVEIIAKRGSAPRDAGTAMKVTMTGTIGTIGGGTLEYQAIALARDLLTRDAPELIRTYALGPNLGQCCGGSVTLRYTRDACTTDVKHSDVYPILPRQPNPADLWIWGAGHVGRAVVDAAPPSAFDITWIDDAAYRFPNHVPAHVTPMTAADMPLLASRAPRQAHHLIFTYSHDIDLALCAALLRRGATSIGVIGSDTKWARFRKRLRDQRLDPSLIICPIGDKSLGKEPARIAQGTIEMLLQQTQQKAFA